MIASAKSITVTRPLPVMRFPSMMTSVSSSTWPVSLEMVVGCAVAILSCYMKMNEDQHFLIVQFQE